MSDGLFVSLSLFVTAIAIMFGAMLTGSDLFSNRWVTNRSFSRFLSFMWARAGRAHFSIFCGAIAFSLISSALFGRGFGETLIGAACVFVLISMLVNISSEFYAAKRINHYWKEQLYRPPAMYLVSSQEPNAEGAPTHSAMEERWRLACLRAGLEDVADAAGTVSTPPLLKVDGNDLLIDPLGYGEQDFVKVVARLSNSLGKRVHSVELERPGLMRVRLEAKRLPSMLALHEVKLPATDGLMFGESAAGPVIVSPKKWPHAMVAGTSGSGKSIFLRFIVMQMIKYYPNAVIVIIDVKREDFEVFERWPNFVRARNAEHLAAIAKELERERKRRENTRRKNWEEVYLIIDEANEVINKKNTRNVERLLSMARSADMHIVLCQQRATTSDTAITGVMRANATMRICFRVENAPDSRAMLNSPAAMNLPMVPGRGIVLDRNTGRNVMIQSPMVTIADASAVIDEMLPRCRPQTLAATLRQLIVECDANEQEIE